MELRLDHKNGWKELNSVPATVLATKMITITGPATGTAWLHGPLGKMHSCRSQKTQEMLWFGKDTEGQSILKRAALTQSSKLT